MASEERKSTELQVTSHNIEDPRPFKCKRCSYAGKTVFEVKNHEKAWKPSKKLRPCGHCDFKACFSAGLVQHMKKYHANLLKAPEESNYECDKCSFSTKEPEQLAKHIKGRRASSVRQCPECEFTSCFHQGLSWHFKIEHGMALSRHSGSTQPKRKFQCNKCCYTSSISQNITEHERRSRNLPVLNCSECELKFCFPHGLILHRKACHSLSSAPSVPQSSSDIQNVRISERRVKHSVSYDESKKFGCGQCSFSTHKYSLLLRHQERARYRNGQVNQCSFCALKFCFPTTLTRHMQSVHNSATARTKEDEDETGQRFSCPECSFTSCTRSETVLHMKMHEMPPQVFFKCPYCDFRSSDSELVRQHKRAHAEEGPFECSFCGKVFNAEINLRRHVLMHKPVHARKRLAQKMDLQTERCEVATYKNCKVETDGAEGDSSGVEPGKRKDLFCCHFCEYKSHNMKRTLLHIKEHDLFRCALCPYLSADELGLKAHQETHVGES